MRKQVLFQGIEPDIKANFKAACARNGRSMKSVLIDYMVKYSNEDKRRDNPRNSKRAQN